jgi:ATP phosphoribosyltransferase regulatory subunit
MPGDARRHAELNRTVLTCFESSGYELVSTPLYEYAGVLEHEVGRDDAAKLVRFVEPETGEVLAFRPDITPQIARVVATRLRDAPMPARLCYEGAVVRRRPERARRERQVSQAGLELIGLSGPEGDLETLGLACAAVRAAGLKAFTLDLSHARIAPSLLTGVAPEARAEIFEALSVKDADGVRRRAEAAGARGAELRALVELPGLWGGPEVFAEAARVLAGTAAAVHVQELEALYQAAGAAGLASDIVLDLGEIWSFSYYTGFMMRILAHGPGEPVASGGRYDQLFSRYELSRPAAGAAIDLGNLAWALDRTGNHGIGARRVLLASALPEREGLLLALRARGIDCAWLPEGDPVAYAKSWRYGKILGPHTSGFSLMNVADGRIEVLDGGGASSLASQVASALERGQTSHGD